MNTPPRRRPLPHLNKENTIPVPLLIILFTVALETMSFGLILAVMPQLIASVRGASVADAAIWGGLLSVAFAVSQSLFTRLCCTNPVRDSSRESSVVAGMHEQTDTPDLQDQELASLQRRAETPWFADDLVRPRDALGCRADRQAWPPAELKRRRLPDMPHDEGAVRHGAPADDRVR